MYGNISEQTHKNAIICSFAIICTRTRWRNGAGRTNTPVAEAVEAGTCDISDMLA